MTMGNDDDERAMARRKTMTTTMATDHDNDDNDEVDVIRAATKKRGILELVHIWEISGE